ncbi:MAG: hypothetical protein ACPLW9_01450 [Minisyncoccales bacterium]
MSYTNKSLISHPSIFVKLFNLDNNLVLNLFRILIFLIIISVLAVSIYQFNIYTAGLYSVKQYEKKINQLTKENQLLEIELAKNSSLVNLERYAGNFEKSNKIEYIRILNGTAFGGIK